MKHTTLLVALASLILAPAATAQVHTSVTPDRATTQPREPLTYTITYTTDTPTILADAWFLLPSHGRPCDRPVEYGEPYGGDLDSRFIVTTPGVNITGRVVTFPGPHGLVPGAPLRLRLNVLTPELGGCFYAGASAHPKTSVLGLAKGAQIFNDQSSILATGGYASSPSPESHDVTITWYMRNGTDHAITLDHERLGAGPGFRYVSSNLSGEPKAANLSNAWRWDNPIVIPAHSEVTRRVNLWRPCGTRSSIRLRIVRDDGLRAGTGDGVHLKLAEC